MLKKQIITDLTTSMKAKDELATSTLRMIKAEIMKYEVSGADMKATDEVVIDLLKKAVKQRREAAEGFTRGGKTEFAEKELKEIEIIEKYLPGQMPEDQVKTIVQETIGRLKPAGLQDFGKVMGAVMGRVKGQADGRMVSKVVRELLG